MGLLFVFALFVVGSLGMPGNLGIDHAGFVVQNASLAADFFIDVFDCIYDWRVEREASPSAQERGWDTIFDVEPSSYLKDVWMLKCGQYHLAQYIELFEWGKTDQTDPRWPRFSHVGGSYIAFTVASVQHVVEMLKSDSFRAKYPEVRMIQDPPMAFPLRGELCTSFFITTPFGMWIEISEWSESTPKHPHLKANQEEADVVMTSPEVQHAQKDPEPKIDHGHPAVGLSLDMIETPFVWIEKNLMEQNIGTITKRVPEGINWMAVVKAHKSSRLAQELLRKGAKGVLVMTVEDAAIMAEGLQSPCVIHIANQVVIPSQLIRLVGLAKSFPKFQFRSNVNAVEDIVVLNNAAKGAGVKLHAMVEVNVGHNRSGTSDLDEVVELVKLVDSKDSLVLDGLTGYEGHTPVLPLDKKLEATQKAHSILQAAKEKVEAEVPGITIRLLAGGGSCNYPQAVEVGILNEIQLGGAVLGDKLYLTMANLENFGHKPAMFVETSIISKLKNPDRANADAGFKSIGIHPFAGLPLVSPASAVSSACVQPTGLSSNHLRLKVSEEHCGKGNLAVGSRMTIIPGYGDSFLSFQKRIYVVSDGLVEDVWEIGQ